MPGYRLDRYELLAPVAEGGMGEVWLARLVGKHGFEKLVAIKTLLPKFSSDDHFRRMFLDEARLASQIEHANVAQISDLGEENGTLYLVMEWVDADSLSKVQRVLADKGAAFPTSIALRVIADTCGGVHAAHELCGPDGKSLGVVHRDISPQNILVTTGGVAKLIDFGIAKARNRLSGETSEGFLKGKVHYMAPEQAFGGAIDGRADVWSLGAILYSFLAGKPAYDGDSQLVTLHKLTSGEPPDPLPAGVPKSVADIVSKALAFRPEDRYATAAEMQQTIRVAMSEAKLAAEVTDVAAFIAEHMAKRATKRRRSVERALKAAVERAETNKLLRGSGIRDGRGGDTPSGFRPSHDSVADADEKATVTPAPIPTGSSNISLAGAGALEAGTPDTPQDRRRNRTAWAVVAGLGALVLMTVAGISASRTNHDAESRPVAGASIPAPTPQAAVPAATPTPTAIAAPTSTSGQAEKPGATAPPALGPNGAKVRNPSASPTAPTAESSARVEAAQANPAASAPPPLAVTPKPPTKPAANADEADFGY